jgi:hypothetical protein
MEFLAFVVGAGVAIVAASPVIPGLRPVAKALVVGGLAVADIAKTAAANAGEQWQDLVAEAKAERDAEAAARAGVVETITVEMPEE